MNNTRLIIVTFAALMTAVGCRGPLDDGRDMVLDGLTLLKANIEALELPGSSADEQIWEKGDKLGLYSDSGQINLEWNIRKSSEGMKHAEFYGEAVFGSVISGYFPYNATKKGNVNRIPCSLPERQDYAPELSAGEYLVKNTECIHATLQEGTLHFAYPFGLLNVNFNLYEQLDLSALRIATDSTIISGALKIAHDGTIVKEYPGKNYIDINFGKTTNTEEIAKGNGIYILLPPAVYEDMKIEVMTVEGKPFLFNMPTLEVKRIKSDEFTVQTATITTSGVNVLTQTDGYLEPTDYTVSVFTLSLTDQSLEQTNGYLEPNEE